MNSTPLLKLEGVCKHYDSPGGPLPVLQGIDLEIAASASLAITGPSGSGKSTLLNLIGALDTPSAGRVLLDGDDLAGLSPAQLCELRNRRIGFVFQFHHLLPQFSVMENVLMPTAIRRPRDSGAGERARRLLHRVGLDHRLAHRPAELSGGERQRVAVVRALINCPRLILADEPTGSLDRAGAEVLAQLLVEIHQEEKAALIVVTHSEMLARHMRQQCDLRDGRIVRG